MRGFLWRSILCQRLLSFLLDQIGWNWPFRIVHGPTIESTCSCLSVHPTSSSLFNILLESSRRSVISWDLMFLTIYKGTVSSDSSVLLTLVLIHFLFLVFAISCLRRHEKRWLSSTFAVVQKLVSLLVLVVINCGSIILSLVELVVRSDNFLCFIVSLGLFWRMGYAVGLFLLSCIDCKRVQLDEKVSESARLQVNLLFLGTKTASMFRLNRVVLATWPTENSTTWGRWVQLPHLWSVTFWVRV